MAEHKAKKEAEKSAKKDEMKKEEIKQEEKKIENNESKEPDQKKIEENLQKKKTETEVKEEPKQVRNFKLSIILNSTKLHIITLIRHYYIRINQNCPNRQKINKKIKIQLLSQ